MTRTVEVTFDGKSLVPHEALNLPLNLSFTVQVPIANDAPKKSNVSWMDVALANPIDGPEDASENFDEYLNKQIRDTHE